MKEVLMVFTVGFKNDIPLKFHQIIIDKALKELNDKTDFIVFDASRDKGVHEDEGRTLIVPLLDLPKKVYVKLDIFPTAESLSNFAGFKVRTNRLITFMLAEEY
jgi:hypothetical protein